MRNKTTKIMQITTNELKKCKQGQEFKIDVVTYTKDKPIHPVPPIVGDPDDYHDSKPPKPPKPTLATVVEMLADVQKTLGEHGTRLTKVENILQKHTEILQKHSEIFERNNLH